MTPALQNTSQRYAVYLAPDPNTALWQFGSRVLGYDAASGLEVAGFRLPSMSEDQWKSATARARTYGFHATLKAPFRLIDGVTEADLISGLRAFALQQTALPPMPLHLSILDENEAGGLLALTPGEPYSSLRRLEAETVHAMEAFRAPLTEDEIKKRNPNHLNQRQKNYLAAYGYPFVLKEFRAHFTLSDRLPAASIAALELEDLMTGHIGTAMIETNELVLFKQVQSNSRFQIIARAPLGEKSI